uniref:Short/branched chain specific acyl-CoA dehydrogenase, mitochondrial n=1 Tax=Amorphochlora amoebiformis TaxID=1561963 RepID=A0A7S0CWR8_9EUKA|mmetsp:Transcript_14946/g.23664  ORF Transcript_14946/g.23664 Transcript_14946/m.23664 type:complete len:409 (+) Transcript_14946:2-1228(+)
MRRASARHAAMQTGGLSWRYFSMGKPTPALTMFSEEQGMLVESIRKFAEQNVAPHVSKMDSEGKLEPSVLSALFKEGLMGIEIPEEYGGAGMGFTEAVLTIEELAKVDPAISVIVDIQNTLINLAFLTYGTEEIKQKYLPRLATDTLASFCLSESSAGSDAFALKTTATPVDGGYRITGNKLWISNAAEAGIFLVFANVDPTKGYKGITAFVVERDAPGLVIGKKEDKLGIRASSTCEVAFDDVEVKSSDVLGEVGKGYKIAIETLNPGRIGIGAQMTGLAIGAYDAAMRYILERKQFGKPVADFQGLEFDYAQAACDIEAARLLVLNAAALKESGKPYVKEAAMAKLYSAQVANKVSSSAVEWMGGVGFTKEYPCEKYYRDAKIGMIYEGTANIHLHTIAKLVKAEY